MTFTWDPTKKGKSFVLSNNNLTANKRIIIKMFLGHQHQFQEGIIGILKLKSLLMQRYLDRNSLNSCQYISLTNYNWTFFGLYLQMCMKFGANGSISQWIGTIGVLLEFRNGLGILSFYNNGCKFGEALNNLTGTFYAALCMYYVEVQVTLDSKSPLQINTYIPAT